MQLSVKDIADHANMIINGYAYTKDGDTTIEKQGQLNEREIREIRKIIKKNYKEMYLKWQQLSNNGYYGE